MISCRTVRWTTALLALAFGSPLQALAALGDDAGSISADSAVLGGTRQVSRAAAWEAHELRLPSGTVVREYLRGKTVFAVAWGGPVMPNLRRLLGAYFEPYVHSPRGREAGHHLRIVVTPDWVVQSAGHQEGFIGRAWLPQHLPAGFDLDTVRAW